MRGVRGVVVLLVLAAATLAAGLSAGCGGSTTPASAATLSATPRAVVTTFAGKSGAFGAADGRGSAARLGGVAGLAFDADGLLWAADAAGTVRTITADAVVKTLAGKAGALGYRDAGGSRARFKFPVALACDPQGDAFILDQQDERLADRFDLPVRIAQTLMRTMDDKIALATTCLDLCAAMRQPR